MKIQGLPLNDGGLQRVENKKAEKINIKFAERLKVYNKNKTEKNIRNPIDWGRARISKNFNVPKAILVIMPGPYNISYRTIIIMNKTITSEKKIFFLRISVPDRLLDGEYRNDMKELRRNLISKW